MGKINKQTMEKQTLKELVLERSKGYESFQRSLLSFAELGAKWQQERSYSDEEVKHLLYLFLEHVGEKQKRTILNINPKEWFDQSKKK